MNKTARKNLIGLCTGILLMFVWIFATVFLTGGRELEDFSKLDWMIFSCFLIIEITTIVITFVFAIKTGKENNKALNEIKSDSSIANEVNALPALTEKRERRRGILMLITAWILSLMFMILGIVLQKNSAGAYGLTLKILLAVSCVIPALLLPLNILLKKKYIAKWNAMNVSELQQYFLSHREDAIKTSALKMKILKRLQLISDIYAGLFCLCAIAIAVCAGALFDTDVSVPLCFYAGILFLTSISRIRFKPGKSFFQEDETYVDADEYPELYRIAKEAQKAVNCSGPVKISLQPDCNAGIAKIGDTYSVLLGAILLGIFSHEELYTILLHEFSHMLSSNSNSNKQAFYYNWICSGGNPHFLSGLTSTFFCYLDTVYSFQYNLYLYSVSVIAEENADRAMAEYCDKRIAASALLKLKYFELFEWEDEASDSESLFASEQPTRDIIQQKLSRFLEKMSARSDEWNKLAKVEIISRIASHPTLKMRLEALGVDDYRVLETANSIEYTNDVNKAIKHVEEMIWKSRQVSYSEDRINLYLKPKEVVDNWESSGKPINATDYSDIISSLRLLGRMSEAKNLCDRAIAELPESATYYARYIKGLFLIHDFDPSGLRFIYEAIEYNSNYIDEGLEQVGQFCCLAGLQTELDEYRRKSVELAQKQKDVYSQISVLKKSDNLSAEHLPPDLQDGILSYIGSIDGGFIRNVYIVRKTIREDFFTSALVIRFDDDADEDAKANFFHKLYWYLDTCGDWQFSLFDFSEVNRIRFDSIPGSCIYQKQ